MRRKPLPDEIVRCFFNPITALSLHRAGGITRMPHISGAHSSPVRSLYQMTAKGSGQGHPTPRSPQENNMNQKIRTAAAFFTLWLGVSYVCAVIFFPVWVAANMALK